MKTLKNNQNVKVNLTLDREFYLMLKKMAQQDYVKVATWTKQFLMKNLQANKTDAKCELQDEKTAEN